VKLRPIGYIRSTLRDVAAAPKQGAEGAPEAWLEVDPALARTLGGMHAGDELIVITWLHLTDRDRLEVHPRGDPRNPLTGVFATRSPHRPNPLGLHRVTLREIAGTRLRIGPIEAIGTKPLFLAGGGSRLPMSNIQKGAPLSVTFTAATGQAFRSTPPGTAAFPVTRRYPGYACRFEQISLMRLDSLAEQRIQERIRIHTFSSVAPTPAANAGDWRLPHATCDSRRVRLLPSERSAYLEPNATRGRTIRVSRCCDSALERCAAALSGVAQRGG